MFWTQQLWDGGPLITWDMTPQPKIIAEAPHTHVWINNEFEFLECTECGDIR